MREIQKAICFAFLTLLFCPNALLAQNEKPNIVLFMVDDMGWMDTSLPFADGVKELNRVYHTPNMERLAKEGTQFTNAYATPVCTPTRVSLLTGMNAAHHQVTNWTSISKDQPTGRVDETFDRIEWNHNGLSPEKGVPHTVNATVFPQLLKDNGYFTVHVGKAHWGSQGTPGANPLNLGFMVNIAGNASGHPQSYLAENNFGNVPGKFTYNAVQGLAEYYGTETFLTEALTREALKTLEEPAKQKQPFYLYLSHYAVHVPIQADERFLDKYIDQGMDIKEAKYATLLEGMDKSLGDVMDYLEENSLAENTIILFMSDNGGLSLSDERAGAPHIHNRPLKSGKGSVYEGGIREPMIVKWPHVTKPGSKVNAPVIIEDFFPSILEMAGLKNQKLQQDLDGKSFVPLLKGADNINKDRLFVWHYPHRWLPEEGPGINYFSAARMGDWKLIYDYKNQKLELYDLINDIGEHNNLALKKPEITKKLAKELSGQLKKWNTIMPTYKENGKPVAWPDELIGK